MGLFNDVVNQLAVQIGPRPPGSKQEEAAARYLDQLFKGKGLDSRVIPFRSVRTFSLTFSVFYALSIAAVLIFPLWAWTALALALVNLLLFTAEINTFRILGSLFAGWQSHNTIARQPAQTRSRRSIVLSAHLDSSRSGILFSPPLVYLFRPIFMGGFLSIAFIPILLGAALFTDERIFWKAAFIPALFLFSGILLLLQREFFGRYTAGANDNASAVAVLAALAEYFAGHPLKNCELWFVGSGSEESGIIGMSDFLKKYSTELIDPLFINLESLGCGQLHYVEREGMFPTLRADSYLLKLAKEAADRKNLPFTAGRFHTILTDNVAVLARRLPGLTLMGCGPRQLIPHWHQSSDVAGNIREENLEQSVELTKEMILNVDQETGE